MSYAIFAGPVVALIGVVAVFFVLRRKAVDKRSMYSARRSQIEHKVRAARQRTLTPHGHAEQPSEAPAATPSPFAATPGGQATSSQTATFQPPPPPPAPPADAPAESTWGPTAPAPGPSPFATPSAEPTYPAPAEPASPAPAEPAYAPPPEPKPYQPPAYQPPQAEPTPAPEPVWTPAPAPQEPATHIESQPAAAASSGSSWEIVGDSKEMSSSVQPAAAKRDKKAAGSASWQLASGDTPGAEAEEVVKPPSAAASIALYAILVVGLVMVLIGVLVMIANSQGT